MRIFDRMVNEYGAKISFRQYSIYKDYDRSFPSEDYCSRSESWTWSFDFSWLDLSHPLSTLWRFYL